MNRKKWEEIYYAEVMKVRNSLGPESWEGTKAKLSQFVKEMDKATEVYFMENTPKERK